MTEKAKTDATEDIIKKHKHTFDKLLLLEEIYEERIIKIKNLELLFMGDKTTSDGYKEWIYKTQVIPLINKEMNAFLGMFENFSFEMTYDKKHFIYMLEDRGNKPTLDKASGYQNFITGLAFRIILTRIGAVGQQMKHLFIDEGFTACDSLNIEKVPYLLKRILSYGEYDSLILMSHLDSVRECTNIHININRDDPFSYINYSNEYPELSVLNEETGEIIKQKGRGRPKKTNLDLG
jgi:DNA repair exonuclease SbcCD ATPase subunit